MKLTRFQKRYLAVLLFVKREKPSVFRLLLARPRELLPVLVIWLFGFAVLFYVNVYAGILLVGINFGATIRIAAQMRFQLLAWPVTEQIIDWAKVEALSAENGA